MNILLLLLFMWSGLILSIVLLRRAGFEYYEVMEDSENEK